MNTNENKNRKNNAGVALIIAIIFLVIMGLLATFAMSRVANHTKHVSAHEKYTDTYLGLISAHDESKHATDTPIGVDPNTTFLNIDPADMPEALSRAMDTYYEANPNAVQLASNPNVRYAAITNTVFYPVPDFRDLTTYATAQYINPDGSLGVQRTVMHIDRASTAGLPNINVWTNAIFAGVQQKGNHINGNVSVHGSVHILGQDAVIGDIAVVLPYVTDMGGNSGIFNNYDGMLADLEARVPALPVDVNGDETLNAKFRVKNGMVNVEGNVHIGDDSPNSGSKGALDGVYLGSPDSDLDINWMGNQTTDGVPNDGVVTSDNGWNTGYDLGDAIHFPYFKEDVSEPDDDPQLYFDKNDDTCYYLQEQTPYEGTITMESGDPDTSFYYNASTGDGSNAVIGGTPGDGTMPEKWEVEAMAVDVGDDHGDFIIWYDGDSDTLFVNGRVAVDGDINFLSGTGQDDTINYEGQGSLLAYDGGSGGGNVQIDASILTTAFPLTNVIGVMAEGDFIIGGNSKLDMMGGFYAQGRIALDMQTTIIGSIVGDYFDMGSNVPDIYQVPELVNAWVDDTRMIGSGNVDAGGNNTNGALWFEAGVAL